MLGKPGDAHLAVVLDVLQLVDDRQLTVPPVVHAGVQLPVQRLELLQRPSDEPSPEREYCYWTVLHSPDLLLVAGPVLPQLQAGDGDQVVLAVPLLLLLGTELNLNSGECE